MILPGVPTPPDAIEILHSLLGILDLERPSLFHILLY